MRDEGRWAGDTGEWDEWWTCSNPPCAERRAAEEVEIARQMGDMADWWREQERLESVPACGNAGGDE